MKPVSYKRILAYLIDILIISMVGSLFTLFIPVSDEYTMKSNELLELVDKYQNQEITSDKYLEEANNLGYIINKESVSLTIVTTVLTIIYFVVVAYYYDGQTLGKKLMKIKIVSNKDSKLTMNNYLIRSLIIDLGLYNIVSIVTILFLTKENYFLVNDYFSSLMGAIYVVSFALILFKKDGRGIHDLLAGTKVIDISKSSLETNVIDIQAEEIESNNEEKEAKKEEKQEKIKEKNKITKSKNQKKDNKTIKEPKTKKK